MLNIQPTHNKITFNGRYPKVSTVKETLIPSFSEFSKTASDSISNTQRGLINIENIPLLNRKSKACEFFGVDNAENIQKQIINQSILSYLKIYEQNIVNFPMLNIDLAENADKLKLKYEKHIKKLSETGVGRWTISSKFYGQNGNIGTHTIGLIKHKDNVYIIDSLVGRHPLIKKQHEFLANLFDENVIFSKKQQQHLDEYTCNNWTHANIDSALDAIKNNRLNENNIDDILPNDINKILEKQQKYVEKKLEKSTISDIIIQNRRKN